MDETRFHLPRRLRRLPTIQIAAPIFFVTFCCARQRALLASERVHQEFIQFAKKSPEIIEAHVGRYVLMPDHAHVFLACEGSEPLSRWVKAIKGVLAAYWRTAAMNGPFWQKGYFDHLLRSDESYEEKWDYVLNNPVRKGLVTDPRDWPFAGKIAELVWGL